MEALAFYGIEDLAPAYAHRFVDFPWGDRAPGSESGTRAGNAARLSVHVFRHQEGSGASVSNRRKGTRGAGDPSGSGTVLLLHGYLDHALVNAKTIRLLVEAGFDVLAPDLPGHGLSDGEEAAIDDFATYAEAVRAVLADAESGAPASPADAATPAAPSTAPAPGPLFAVGHSAGAAAVLAYCNRYGCPFKSVVFIAPLVRTVGWWAIKVSLPILRLFSRRIFRRPGACSSDPDFVDFHKADPRMAQTASLKWSRAMLDWEARLEEYTRFPDPVVVIQGTKDSVVAWRHNLRFLGRKIPNLSITLVPRGMHCLLNEREELRVHVEKLILDGLDLSRVPGYEVP